MKNICLIEDIFFIEEYNNIMRHKVFTVGSVQQGVALHVSHSQYTVLLALHELTENQPFDPQTIRSQLRDEYLLDIDVDDLCSHLWEKGLLKGSDGKKNSEAEMVGVKLFDRTLDHLSNQTIRFAKALKIPEDIVLWLMIPCVLFMIFNWQSLLFNSSNHLFSFRQSDIAGFLASLAIGLLGLLIHEFAHIISAIREGMRQINIRVILYAGFIPMYYTKYPEMIRLKSKQRGIILFAGIRANMILVIVSGTMLSAGIFPDYGMDIWGKVLLVNVQFILLNSSPITMGDGYFLLLNALGLSGIRIKMWQYLKQVWTGNVIGRPLSHKIAFSIYLIFSLLFLLVNLLITVRWLTLILLELPTLFS
jgi:hypothetical protein